jgi:hypothetical protein
MTDVRYSNRFEAETLKGTDNLDDRGTDASKLLKWKLKKKSMRM